MTPSILFRAVEIDGTVQDCRVAGPSIMAVGPQLRVADDDEVIDGRGGALIAGLADHHLHLLATAARTRSVDVAASLHALRDAPGDGWIRAVGAEAELTRADIDAVEPRRPVRVQHVGGSLWTLNSPALDRLGIDGPERATGQLWRADDRLRALLRDEGTDNTTASATAGAADIAGVGAYLARCGVTHCTDATPDLDAATIGLLSTAVPQHLLALGAAEGSGPRKIVVGDHELPDPDALAATIADTHAAGRPVALHVVTRAALVVTVAALHRGGVRPGDRIEHAAVCDDDQARTLAALGLVVVTQPGLLARHGDRYLREVEPADRPWLWRCGGFAQCGVAVALSSDAPYGPLDPWATLRAARDRRTDGGLVIGASERVSAEHALGMMQTPLTAPAGPRRRVAAGAVADVVLLHTSLSEALDVLDASVVRKTFIGGVAALG